MKNYKLKFEVPAKAVEPTMQEIEISFPIYKAKTWWDTNEVRTKNGEQHHLVRQTITALLSPTESLSLEKAIQTRNGEKEDVKWEVTSHIDEKPNKNIGYYMPEDEEDDEKFVSEAQWKQLYSEYREFVNETEEYLASIAIN